MGYSGNIISQFIENGRTLVAIDDGMSCLSHFFSCVYFITDDGDVHMGKTTYTHGDPTYTVDIGAMYFAQNKVVENFKADISPYPFVFLLKTGDNNLFVPYSIHDFSIINSENIYKIFYTGIYGSLIPCVYNCSVEEYISIVITPEENRIKERFEILLQDNENDTNNEIEVLSGTDYTKIEIPEELHDNETCIGVAIKSGLEFDAEKEFLSENVKTIRKNITSIRSSSRFVSKYEVVRGGDDGTEMAQLRSGKSASSSDYRRIQALHELAEVPYRYRIDIDNDGKLVSIYLGASEFKEGDIQIHSIYSDFGKRIATYNPRATELNKSIKLRRDFKISSSILFSFTNLPGSEGKEEMFREGLTDPFLIKIFKMRRKEHDIRDIILTIQEDQNKIVDESVNKNMIVQGCAGSGKTMIMMHRLSRLQNWVKAFEPREVLIITPNNQYEIYLKAVTEGLAITNISQSTLEEYYKDILREYNKEFSVKNKIEKEIAVNKDYIKFIYSQEFVSVFREKYLELIEERHDVLKTVNEMMTELGSRIPYRSKDIEETIPAFIKECGNTLRQYLKTDDELALLKKSREEVENDLLDIEKLYKQWTHIAIYRKAFEVATEGKRKELGIKRIQRTHKFDLYARVLFCNMYFVKDLNLHKFICIDEGQDISVAEYRLLQKLTKAVFNIYGDTNQTLNPETGINDWQELDDVFSKKIYNLDQNYRNSNQITEYTNTALDMHMKKVGIDDKEVIQVGNEDIVQSIEDIQFLNDERWAILISRTVNKKQFLSYFTNPLVSPDKMGKNYISLMYVDEVKGFEFDKVYVMPKGMSRNEKYVAYTRALNELVVGEE